MTGTKTILQDAPVIDFTASISGAHALPAFGPEFVSIIRSNKRPGAVVVIDRAVGMQLSAPAVIRDHLNLMGSSPLLGPNHEYGERFPVVQGIYLDDCLSGLSRVVAAGLKSGVEPSESEIALLKSFGAQACCYNAVPAMLVAAHARCRMLAILVPQGQQLSESILKEISTLTGAKI